MIRSPLMRRVSDALEVPRDLLLGRYPSFVTGGPLAEGDVPVFVFHSVEPVRFGAQLGHLARNGYVTLSGSEYFDHLTGRRPASRNAVLLTFDDARGSLWSVGAPLLRRHSMRGVVFVVPGRVRSRPAGVWPTLDDVPGTANLADVLAREEGEGAFLFWDEIETLVSDGVFEFENHTFAHTRIHSSVRLAGFVTPELRVGYRSFDLPVQRDLGRDLVAEEIPLGAPILGSSPRLSESVRLFENPEARKACADAVARIGAAEFFARPGWDRELRGLVRRFPATVGSESAAERSEAVEQEIRGARSVLEEHTGRPVRHLCYPWHATSVLAHQTARATGHSAAFGGKTGSRPISRSGDDPFAIARIGEDWLESLPGRGRRGLLDVLYHKCLRRLPGRA